MLKYLVILLDDAATSFCHYDVKRAPRLMDEATLKAGIMFAMKQNLSTQFVYSNGEIPISHKKLIETIDHTNIMPATNGKDADVLVYNGVDELRAFPPKEKTVCVLRTTKEELTTMRPPLLALGKVERLSVVMTDLEAFSDSEVSLYQAALDSWVDEVGKLYLEGKTPQVNLLTDRIMLDSMNNCNAGEESVTLAPDGKFYVCPAFYEAGDYDVGNLTDGLSVKNQQLYRLDHAPICRHCDAYQCKRCAWLNRKLTGEVNTPGHQQCVVAHCERNASRKLLAALRTHTTSYLPDKEIKELDYLDPFDNRKQWINE